MRLPLGGSPAYTINWGSAQGSGSDPRINLPAGTFTVTVTDNNNCPAVASFTLTQPPALNISCSATAVTLPSGNDGTASVVVSGGTSGYTYLWNTGASIPNISGLLPGTYCVTVTDALGCTASCCASVTGTGCTTAVGTMGLSVLSACSPDCITATYNNSAEVTDANDIVQFVLHTGSGNNIMGEISRNSTPAFCFNPATMVFGTTYYISAVAGDALPNGNVDLNHPCTQISVGTPVVYYQTPTATIVPPAQISCSNPVITLDGSNSTGNNITYSWAASVGGNIVGASNLSSAQANAGGNYQLTVAAPGGCSATASVQVANISNTITATITASPSNIINCAVASVTLTANTTGLSGTPSYEWRNSDGILLSQNANFTLNSDGVISLFVVDMLTGCSDSDQITIIDNSQYPPLLASPPALITCNTPSITLTGSSLAGNTIQLAWATISGTDTLLISSTGTAVTSTPGIYHLIGVDPSNGCTNAISVQVNQNTIAPIAAIGPASNIDCQNTPVLLTGSATGASGSYSYQWATSNGNILSGANTASTLVDQAGSYQITVTDNNNGCTDTESITLTAAQAPTGTLSINQPACTGDDGSILITVQGGTAPYHFSLNGGTETSQNLFNNLNPGNYDVAITDANDCSFLVNGTITPPLDFNIQLSPTITIKSGLSTTLEVEANVPNSQISSVQWSPSTGLSCDTCLITEASPERSILYSVVVVTSEGCRDQATVQIKVEDIGIYAPNILNYEDATNSSFTIYTEPGINLSIKTLQVFSRWGEKVFEQKNFEPNNPSLGWKGEFEGKKMDPAVFVWYAVVILPGNREVLLSGDITVVK